MRPISSTLLLVALLGAPFFAQDEGDKIPAGHSGHGDVFNEGPRQGAFLMEHTGDVSFPVTTTSAEVQRFIDQGIGQLHGFWYFECERSFRHAASLDPDCAMAYWGAAMANIDNEKRARGFAHEAWLRREGLTRREQLYIDALARLYAVDRKEEEKKADAPEKADSPEKADAPEGEAEKPNAKSDASKKDATPKKLSREDEKKRRQKYVKDLEKLVYEFPDDIEAKALLVNQLWIDQRFGFPIHSRQANQALLDQVFAANPMHPAHHYRIHLWDTKDEAYRVVGSAARAGQSAPGIAHMWHMGGHIFDRLGRYGDTAFQQEASARVDHAHMMRDLVMPFEIHNYAHNNEWLVRSLNHVGRIRDALALAENMIELPRHPVKNAPAKRRSGAWYGQMRLLQTLGNWELWPETLEYADTEYLAARDNRENEATRLLALGRARLMTGDLDGGRDLVEQLAAVRHAERAARADAVDEAEEKALGDGKSENDAEKEMTAAIKSHRRPLRSIERALDSLEGLVAFAEERHDDAFAILEKAKYPKVHLSQLLLAADRTEKAVKIARKAADDGKGSALPWANLVEVLWRADEKEEAREAFEELRKVSGRFDLDVAPLARLEPIAAELGFGSDWRVAAETKSDVGERPELSSLGPFRWKPTVAPEWTLPGSDGQQISLADYRGRPVLVVFFLGFGCVHCVDQLAVLKPMANEFERAGIEIVTIGTDSAEQVRASLASKDEGFPFRILADPESEVFKRYRCWDDFEDMTLHGTFLIDGNGLVRWLDISYEPFMETEFLLAECRRLLAIPAAPSARPAVGSGSGRQAPGAGR